MKTGDSRAASSSPADAAATTGERKSGSGDGPKGTTTVSYYDVLCGTCGTSCFEGSDYTAYSDPGGAVEEAQAAEWARDERGVWQCVQHKPHEHEYECMQKTEDVWIYACMVCGDIDARPPL